MARGGGREHHLAVGQRRGLLGELRAVHAGLSQKNRRSSRRGRTGGPAIGPEGHSGSLTGCCDGGSGIVPGRPGYAHSMDAADVINPVQTNGDRPEGALERADRNMNELLQELRVAQTGVQILFAFLLTLVFQQRFADITEVQRWTYVVTLLLSVVTAGLLVAPAAVHRFTFQRGLKMETVLLGHRLFTVGLAMLAVTLAGGVLLVLDVAVGSWFAVPVALVSLLLLLSLWNLLPLPLLQLRHARSRPGAARSAGHAP